MHQMGTVGDMIHMPSLFTCGNHMTNRFKVNYMLCMTTETCGNHMFTCGNHTTKTKMAEALVVFTDTGS